MGSPGLNNSIGVPGSLQVGLFDEWGQGVASRVSGPGAVRSGGSSQPADTGRAAEGCRLDPDGLSGSSSLSVVPRRHEVRAVECKCRSAWCPHCAVAFYGEVRAFVVPCLGVGKRWVLLSLSVDRKLYGSGEAAWRYADPLVRRLLRLVGFTKWLKVLSFGSGVDDDGRPGIEWPHWHILVDLADVPNVHWARKKIWSLWRHKWAVGGCDLPDDRDPKFKGRTGVSAAMYAINYQQRQGGACASWVKSLKRMRAWEVGGELRKALQDAYPDRFRRAERARGVAAGDVERVKVQRRSRTIGERLTECGDGGSNLIEVSEYDNGVTFRKWLGTLPLSPGQIALLVKMGYLDGSEAGVRTEVWEAENLVEQDGMSWVLPCGRVVVTVSAEGRDEVRALGERMERLWVRACTDHPEEILDLVSLEDASDEAFADAVFAEGVGGDEGFEEVPF